MVYIIERLVEVERR